MDTCSVRIGWIVNSCRRLSVELQLYVALGATVFKKHVD